MLLVAAGLFALFSAGPEICPRGSGPLRSLQLPDGSQITGAGGTQRGDTVWYGWTGARCVASIEVHGIVTLSEDERRVTPAAGAGFVVRASGDVSREYRIEGRGLAVAEQLLIGGAPADIGPSDREWIAAAAREYARRAGLFPARRAIRILETQGLDSLVAEAERVPREDVEAEYLIVPLLSQVIKAADRPAYVQRAALLLGTGSALAHLLTSVPTEWQRDTLVTLRILESAVRIEPDDDAISVLRRTVRTGAVTGSLAIPVRSIIATLQNSETRTDLTRRYFPGSR